MNVRAEAALVLTKVIQHGVSLNEALAQTKITDKRDLAYLKQLSIGSVRWYLRLNALSQNLLLKPLKAKYFDIHCLIVIGLYQIIYLNTPEYAAVSETVQAAQALHKPWAKALINQTLRHFCKNQSEHLSQIDNDLTAKYAHPKWLIEMLQKSWPQQWQQILTENNDHPPQTLRINLEKISREKYLQQLDEANISANIVEYLPSAIILEKQLPVEQIPGFFQGLSSIQDGAGQKIVELLDLAPAQRILDACAAPGSKTCHLLETIPDIEQCISIEKNADRAKKIIENFNRLGLEQNKSQIIIGDCCEPERWWDGKQFDRVLLDAPCSATGVIRRHPDIKLLRQFSDIQEHSHLQKKLIQALWPLLKSGGKLLYSTCSVLPEENEEVIDDFYKIHSDVEIIPIMNWGTRLEHGCQLFPGDMQCDGFYYALLQKKDIL